MKFSGKEKKDLFYAGIMISLAFAILLSGGFKGLIGLFSGVSFALVFFSAFITAGLGFLLHELMHKYVAQSYGIFAEFRAFYGYLWLALLFSLAGFIIAAPGAVFLHGFITRERNGKISVAGPVTNIVLAIIFLILLVALGSSGVLGSIFVFGLKINSLLAAFNMIPVMPFDGAKVIAWDKSVYYITLGISIGLFIVSFFV
jgi:Zn-dependent protease